MCYFLFYSVRQKWRMVGLLKLLAKYNQIKRNYFFQNLQYCYEKLILTFLVLNAKKKITFFHNTYGFNSFAITGTTISSFGLSFGSLCKERTMHGLMTLSHSRAYIKTKNVEQNVKKYVIKVVIERNGDWSNH
ncbi:hypothetical protein BpHYR1_047686 [Brachionus plicatilis]|uniref:Uncharacterized protein n=1 Tax=Brachionus plicatilis TaxID=10195 RepID=A0A3M7T2Y1_BRAPC|nr:hypothetical protein BpHYR1_047686 [Brachionus plicatilis]